MSSIDKSSTLECDMCHKFFERDQVFSFIDGDRRVTFCLSCALTDRISELGLIQNQINEIKQRINSTKETN